MSNAKARALFMYELNRLTVSKIRNYIHQAKLCPKKKAFSREGFAIEEGKLVYNQFFDDFMVGVGSHFNQINAF